MKVSEVTKSNKRAVGTQEVRRGNDAFCVKQTATASQTWNSAAECMYCSTEKWRPEKLSRRR